MPGLMSIFDMKSGTLQLALILNPTAEFFPWMVQEYPQSTNPAGVPRSAVEAAYQSKIGEDIGKGATFTNIYAGAAIPNGFVTKPTQVS
jgi:hypothetical protein